MKFVPTPMSARPSYAEAWQIAKAMRAFWQTRWTISTIPNRCWKHFICSNLSKNVLITQQKYACQIRAVSVICLKFHSWGNYGLGWGPSRITTRATDHGHVIVSFFILLPLSFRKGWGVIVGGLTLSTITCHEPNGFILYTFALILFRGETRARLFTFLPLSALIIHPILTRRSSRSAAARDG